MYFNELNIRYFIKQTLEQNHIVKLTKIQEESLPFTLKNKSAIITGQTGSGKTLCYVLPILNTIDLTKKTTQAIIVVPTKELARQVYSKLLEFQVNEKLLRIGLIIGNSNLEQQKNQIKLNPPHIVVGTTVRILELIQQKIINRNIKTIALDEVDMLLDQGFAAQVNEILSFISSPDLQKIACSATTHESIANQFSKYFKDTKVISATKTIWANQSISHNIVYQSNNSDPLITFKLLLKQINPYLCFIFANTRKEANMLYDWMKKNNYENCILIHKDLSTRQRKHIFEDINTNKYQYVVATDLVSRGIDIVGADVVISYGLPQEGIWYMHRAGRVGRYKDSGTVFVVYRNGIDENINRLTRKGINFHYYLINNEKMTEKPLRLHLKHKKMFDTSTNEKIKRIIYSNSKKVKPGYKKKIKMQINKIKQKVRHEYIEKQIKKQLIHKNIQDSKAKKH